MCRPSLPRRSYSRSSGNRSWSRTGRARAASAERAVVAAPPDGYTLLAGNTSVLAVGPAVSASAGYHPVTNFAPVAKVSESYPDPGGASVAAVEDREGPRGNSKAHPGKLNYGHTGAGGLPHLTGELFMARSGARLTGVPFRSGGEAVTAVLSGTVETDVRERHHPAPAHSRGR